MDLPSNLAAISGAVLLEKFGYGIGSVGHMLYMVQQVSPGRFQMSHYAFATSVMALCKCVTGWVSGPLFTAFNHNYHTFFIFVLAVSIPPVIVAYFAPFPLAESRASPDRDKRSAVRWADGDVAGR
jgi:PAT family beta-lactamase induction signal transducer AmpG